MADTYQVITDRVIALLEAGTVPWHRPWMGESGRPRSLSSGKAYRGVNAFMLAFSPYECPYWATFRQVKALGGHVRKGEKGTPIVFWKLFKAEDKTTGKEKTWPMVKHYAVFNVEQCDGIPAEKIPEWRTTDPIPFTVNQRCDAIPDGYIGCPAIHHRGTQAFYSPTTDIVTMPARESFESPEAYYSTLFHELTHSTGHKSRLKRFDPDSRMVAFGTHDYSREELVAEMGAAFLSAHCAIEDKTLDASASYIASWLKKLRSDPKFVVQGAAAAQKSTDKILGTTFED